MVTRFGMSPELGNVDLASNFDSLSASTKRAIESEVRRITEESYVRTVKLLTEKRKELELLAKALVDYETLTSEEAFKVIKGEKLSGKIAVPSGSIKVPNMGTDFGTGGEVPEVPKIPGSQPPDNGKEPPTAGGAIA